MRMLSKTACAALMGAGALLVTANRASAEVVCNDEGDCWHIKTHYDYKPEFRVQIHPDDWKWKEGERHKWREHEGRGYWKGNSWTDF